MSFFGNAIPAACTFTANNRSADSDIGRTAMQTCLKPHQVREEKEMKEKRTLSEDLARNTLDDIPQAKEDAKDIVGLVKSSGRVTGYQLSDGSAVSKEDGIEMAKNGEIKNVGIAHRRDSEYLKSLPDGEEGNNLGNLPSVSQGRIDSDSLS